MTQKKGTTLLLIISVTLLFLASFVVTTVRAPPGPSYTLGASPTVLNEEKGKVIITLTITRGTANTGYIFRYAVMKPRSAGQSNVNVSFTTTSTRESTKTLRYQTATPT